MNRTVLVTGASRGIGRAIASAFAAEGDRLIITCSRSEQELLNFKKELEETFHTEVLAIFLPLNMSNNYLNRSQNASVEWMSSSTMPVFPISGC